MHMYEYILILSTYEFKDVFTNTNTNINLGPLVFIFSYKSI